VFSPNDHAFLLAQHQDDAAYHKNIAYRPLADRLTGYQAETPEQAIRLKALMRDFSQQVITWATSYLSPYANTWQVDYTSFRPIEEEHRPMRLRARNDLLHVDSFPTRQTHGKRILRVFINLHPERIRVWKTGEPFAVLAEKFKNQMPTISSADLDQPGSRVLARLGKWIGTSWGRSPYDRWMLDFHNWMKENSRYQETSPVNTWKFPPGSTWLVYTDGVSHAVLSGQHAMEQTFLISPDSWVMPEAAPIQILKRLYR
jgi:hypothetical protein